MANRCNRTISNKTGESLVEFALVLPLFVLLIVGVFDLGRAFFAFIAISNAAREGTRVVQFWPAKLRSQISTQPSKQKSVPQPW